MIRTARDYRNDRRDGRSTACLQPRQMAGPTALASSQLRQKGCVATLALLNGFLDTRLADARAA